MVSQITHSTSLETVPTPHKITCMTVHTIPHKPELILNTSRLDIGVRKNEASCKICRLPTNLSGVNVGGAVMR